MRTIDTGDVSLLHLSNQQEANEAHYKDKQTGAALEVIDRVPLLEFLAENYKSFGCQLSIITDSSPVCRLLLSEFHSECRVLSWSSHFVRCAHALPFCLAKCLHSWG